VSAKSNTAKICSLKFQAVLPGTHIAPRRLVVWVRCLTQRTGEWRRAVDKSRDTRLNNPQREYLGFCFFIGACIKNNARQAMTGIMKLFLVVLVGFSALPFGSCKSEIDKAGKAVDETMDKAKEQTGRAMEKTGAAIKETGEKMQESGKAEKKE
jgi:hypothetical protein